MIDIWEEAGSFFSEPFRKHLFIALLAIGAFMLAYDYSFVNGPEEDGRIAVHYFYSPSCPHCALQEPFNSHLAEEFPQIAIVRHDVAIPEESRTLLIMAQNFSLGPESLGTPTTIIGNRIFVGFESENTTGSGMREAVEDCIGGACGWEEMAVHTSTDSLTKGVDLPIFGVTDLSELSLPALAAVLGLIDGFNPCAMWVLVYLMGLLMNLNDKRRLALIVGTFLFASGALYFLFMTAWLNAFLFLGYVRAVTIIVGLVALGGGILSIKEFLDTKGAMVCQVTGGKERKKLTIRMRELISAPLSWATFLGIVFLAFTINSIEFVCSSAIPAVFTQVLALKGLSALERYAYIALYDFFFMLDDLLIFGSALLIIGSAGERYARYCKIVGGAVMLILGMLLLFAPQMLR